jgi:hypothetical protein
VTSAAPFSAPLASYRLLVVVARLTVTSPIRLVLVWWINKLPSLVARMCRIVPTPDGIAQLWKRSVFGSNRTSASGRRRDSLYQMMSLTTVIA